MVTRFSWHAWECRSFVHSLDMFKHTNIDLSNILKTCIVVECVHISNSCQSLAISFVKHCCLMSSNSKFKLGSRNEHGQVHGKCALVY